MTIFIGSDHRGYRLKEKIKLFYSLGTPPIVFEDVGCFDEKATDYPLIVSTLAEKMCESDRGVLICGSGTGMSIAANRYSKFRAALCFNRLMADLARKHNDANILTLGADFIESDLAIDLVEIFMNTDFEGGRHAKRLAMLKSSI
jgi:ribose 5-phosphate isomerase B